MIDSRALRVGSLVLAAGLAGCSDAVPVAPVPTPSSASLAAANSGGTELGEVVRISSRIAEINARLAATGSALRLMTVQMRMASRWDGVTSSIIFANDRIRGIGSEWVKGDPRRGGNPGVTYQVDPELGVRPFMLNPDRVSVSQAPYALLDDQIEEGMAAWRALSCAAKPIARVGVPAGTDPNFLDQFFSLVPPNANYAQTADIVQGGWQTPTFFRTIAAYFGEAPSVGDGIIGITFTFNFVDENDELTDIDRNGKADLGLAEIYYNAVHLYDNSGILAVGPIDFYSVIAHESGHALGLGHLGKIFVSRHDAADGSVSLSQVKYAPKALMNAAYIAGRDEITGSDNSQFCEIWSSR